MISYNITKAVTQEYTWECVMGVWLSPVPLSFILSQAPKPRDWCYFCLERGGLHCGILKFLEMKGKHFELWKTLEIVFPREHELPVSRVISRVFKLKRSWHTFSLLSAVCLSFSSPTTPLFSTSVRDLDSSQWKSAL